MMKAFPEKCLVTEGARGEVHDDAKAVEVGRYTCERDEAGIADVVGGFGGDDPTGEEVGYRRHAVLMTNVQ